MRKPAFLTALAASALLAGSALAQTTPPRIGSAAIITNSVSGALGTTHRELKRGDGVFREEMIKTGTDSRAQFLFADETTLSVGPNSEIVLDKFVYDPDKKQGEVAFRAATGAFRFVSGSAQKDAYKINTPAGSIGIRGTIVEVKIVPGPNGYVVTLTLWEGSATFCITPSNCKELTKPGTYIIISGNQFSAEQVLNALGCGGAGGCSEYSYNKGDEYTYIAYVSDRVDFGFDETTTAIVKKHGHKHHFKHHHGHKHHHHFKLNHDHKFVQHHHHHRHHPRRHRKGGDQ
jgi:hypothetical protein